MHRTEGRPVPADRVPPVGATVEIPAPLSITLDAEKLKDYAD
ncbi:hypothetical protein [Streptomyces deccanensis]|nr:hypothetical protein [Streptomyces deccanensis]